MKKNQYGYNLNNIKTPKKKTVKKAKTAEKSSNMGIWGFVIIMGLIASMFLPTLANAKQPTVIVEKFSCSVANADFKESQRQLETTPRTDANYDSIMNEYEAVSNALDANECKGEKGEK